ncbi:MAG: hypothetical protein Phyf2KO_02970 [Phycisphaerales bacterium]
MLLLVGHLGVAFHLDLFCDVVGPVSAGMVGPARGLGGLGPAPKAMPLDGEVQPIPRIGSRCPNEEIGENLGK